MTRITIALALMLSCHVACSSTTEAAGSGNGTPPASTEAGAACGKAGRDGKTSSFDCGTCSAGQYCRTSATVADACKPGCTSDANCGEAEQCVRCGTETVGTCQSCSRDVKDACQTTPPPPEPDAGPIDPCMRVAGQDFMCQAPLAKAYECFGKDPLQAGCEHTKMGSPTVFCCAK